MRRFKFATAEITNLIAYQSKLLYGTFFLASLYVRCGPTRREVIVYQMNMDE